MVFIHNRVQTRPGFFVILSGALQQEGQEQWWCFIRTCPTWAGAANAKLNSYSDKATPSLFQCYNVNCFYSMTTPRSPRKTYQIHPNTASKPRPKWAFIYAFHHRCRKHHKNTSTMSTTRRQTPLAKQWWGVLAPSAVRMLVATASDWSLNSILAAFVFLWGMHWGASRSSSICKKQR